MKRLKILISVLSVCLLISFVSVSKEEDSYFNHLFKETPKKDIPEPDQLMGKIIDQTVQEIKQEYGFFPIGVGMSGRFKGVGISFQLYRPMEKNEARAIVFDCAKKLLKNIQSSEEIQPYLESQPFSLENVGITLYSVKEDYHLFPHPNIGVVKIGRDGLLFRTQDPDDKFKYKEVTEESFEEARTKIAEFNAEMQRRQVAK